MGKSQFLWWYQHGVGSILKKASMHTHFPEYGDPFKES